MEGTDTLESTTVTVPHCLGVDTLHNLAPVMLFEQSLKAFVCDRHWYTFVRYDIITIYGHNPLQVKVWAGGQVM